MHYLSKEDPRVLRGRTALLRLDFNTEDDWRMRAVLPTIKFLLKNNCKVVIMSHRGRPTPVVSPASGSVAPSAFRPMSADRKLSLKKDAAALSRFLRRPVRFIPDFDFEKIRAMIDRVPARSVFLLENLRFMIGEEQNDDRLAWRLASLGDFYVNDAFAVSHRANASVAAITSHLPSYAGLELEAEIENLSRVISHPRHPLVLVVGGAKISDKLGVLTYFRSKADRFLLGGGPANTVLAERGMDVKQSLCDRSGDRLAIRNIARYPNVMAPVDEAWKKNAIVDIGPRTAAQFAEKIRAARTIVWSGPLGLIDEPPFDRGSRTVARAIAANRKALSVAGGGETVMFIKRARLDKKLSFISTGGGAMLDFLAGRKLPGLEALARAKKLNLHR